MGSSPVGDSKTFFPSRLCKIYLIIIRDLLGF